MLKDGDVNLFLLSLWLSRAIAGDPRTDITPPKTIAVIGAGIGGASAAYFLREQFGRGVKIDVYESGRVGGRLATASISGQDYEMGGATIHPLHLYMKRFAQMLGLKEDKHPDHLLAVYDGVEFVFEESEWFLVNMIKLIWRYGFDYLRVKRWAESYLHRFMKIYQYQSEGYCFTSVEKLLYGLGDYEFVQMTKHSIDQALQKIGISQRFMKEMVDPIMRLSSGHRVNISAFGGMISLLGTASDLWTVEGGNKLICSGLLYSAKVNLIQGKVISIDTKRRPQRNGELVTLYEVNYTEGADTAYSMYDIVIIAAPFHPGKSQVRLRAFSQPISFTSGRYRQTVITLVEGSLNASYFGCRGSGPFRPTAIGTTANSGSSILGASVSRPVTAAPDDRLSTSAPVWKVLSPKPLGQEQLSQLFPSREALREARYLSQPRYSPNDQSPPFILHDHLYYLNAIEWAASTLEIMALSAKNAALLSHHRWFQQLEKVDQELKQKDEL